LEKKYGGVRGDVWEGPDERQGEGKSLHGAADR